MRHEVHPLIVPRENACPDLVAFVGFDFALEGA